jgi:hypothetical protein
MGLIGNKPNEVPRNADLGTAAFLDVEAIKYAKGFFDLKPISLKDDGTNGWSITTVNGFSIFTATSTNALKRMVAIQHPDHDIDLDLETANTGAFFHIHWTHDTAAPTGVAIVTVSPYAGKPNGTFVALTSLNFTLTPTAGNRMNNTITELAIPSDWYQYLTPDAIWNINIDRNRGANASDTFANSIYLFSADAHVRSSGALTINKDIGTGWVNS